MTTITFLQTFHFLRPLWLLTLPMLWGMVAWLAHRSSRKGDWSSIIDADLLPLLRLEGARNGGEGGRVRNLRPWPWLALAWSLAVLALAGPSWHQESAPAYRAPAAWVVVLDLSPSMETTDVSPNRFTRARYAIDDVLNGAHDAKVGMVVFSGESFTVTPLTSDVATVRALTPSLAPEMMPSAGDNLAPALDQALKLFKGSTAKDKRIVLVTDGFADPEAALRATAELKKEGVSLNVVGVGTASGAPIRGTDGRFTPDAQGRPQMAQMNAEPLQRLAAAAGGRYVALDDIPTLIADMQSAPQEPGEAQAAPGVGVVHWFDAGAFLLPLVLLLCAFLTRPRWL